MSEIIGLYSRDPNEDAPGSPRRIVADGTPVIPVMIDLTVEAGQLVFKMKDMRDVLAADSVIGESTDAGYYIRVRSSQQIIAFELSPFWDWEFDGTKPFTLKQKKNGNHDNTANFHCRDLDPMLPRTLLVEMVPSKQPKGEQGFKQGYNLYVKMGQPKGGMLPIRIDPIVKNPPPDNGKNGEPKIWLPI